jgi:hypothetical protein
LLRSHEIRRQGDHILIISFPPTRNNMDVLQADAFAIPDDSVNHVTNARVNMQVTARAAATVPASTPVDPADRSAASIVPASTLVDLADISAAAVRAQDTAAPTAAAIVPASTLVDIAETIAAAVRARDSTGHEDVGRPRVDSSLPRSPRVAQQVASLAPVFALRSAFLLVSFDRG